MLPRLEAEESLLTARRLTIGTKSELGEREFTATQKRWMRAADPERATAEPAAKPSKKDLKSLGVGSRPWPKAEPPQV